MASDDGGLLPSRSRLHGRGVKHERNGVLIRPDLLWRDRWVAMRSANRDPDSRNTKRVSHEDFDLLIRNVYKVLLTRGLRGVYLYSTDAETQQLLDSLLS